MIEAIITRLKTGSVSRVYAKGDKIEDPKTPYTVVAQTNNFGSDNLNQEQYQVTPHFARGYWAELNTYLDECRVLLSGQQLTDDSGATAVVEPSGDIGPLVDTNDDGSISRELTFIAPGMVL